MKKVTSNSKKKPSVKSTKTIEKTSSKKVVKPTAKVTPVKATAKAKSTLSKKTILKPVAKITPSKKVEVVIKKNVVVTEKPVEKPVQSDNQYDTILNHLIKHGSINTMEAILSYGVLRLGAVIHNLRQGGLDIKTGVHTFKNQSGRNSNVAKYILKS
jgi:hypothetical protein